MPVIITTKSMLKITKPKNTPIVLKRTDVMIIKGLITELNCATMIKKIRDTAIPNARNKKAWDLACSSCSPVYFTVIPSGTG